MDARQARALLELIADLYTLAQMPESPPVSTMDVEKMNGEIKEPVKFK